ncbi:MAG: efflux RND transporter permease subunit [Candidatus Cloacimonadota bacterium]|nr:MAG: efflux RND transporter permease subunit [Candidatus Cloacimonadota bacterium]
MKITDVSINRPLAVSMLFLAFIIFGFISLTKLPVDLFPNMSFPMIMVMTGYPGAGPEEIETEITEALERLLGTVNNLDKITSTTSENTSMIMLNFEWGTDLDAAANDVRDKLGIAMPFFPDAAENPLIFKFDISQQPVIMYNILGEIDQLELNKIADEISDKLQRVGGVASSFNMGEEIKEVQIKLDPLKLKGTGITPEQIMGILRMQNVNYPLGNVEDGQRVYILRTVGQYRDIDDIEKTVIGYKNGIPILLSHIADISSQSAEQTSISRTNGVQSIWGFVQKRADANTVAVSNNVIKKLDRIGKELPPGVKIDIIFNQADFITKSVRSTLNTLIIGAFLAIFILFLFFGNFRSTLYVAVTIPITIFFALFLMYIAGMSLNTISLGGLTVAIGMVLDSAIVVFEAIFRQRKQGKEARAAASAGTQEVGMAISASTLTTVAVFLPLLLVSGFVSFFFRELALTVTFALISSLIVALTIVPMLSSRFLKIKRYERGKGLAQRFSGFYTKIEQRYTGIIGWALQHRKTVILSTLGVFIVSLFLVPFIGTEMSPETDEGEIIIKAEMPVGTNLETTDKAITQLEEIILREVPEVDILATSIGSGKGIMALFMGTSGPHSAQIHMELVDRENRKRSDKDIMRDLRPKVSNIPGLKVYFSGGGMEEFFGGKPIVVKIIGYDIDKARLLTEELLRKLNGVEGLVDLKSSLGEGKPEYRLIIDRQKAAQFGLTPLQIGTVLRSRIEGIVTTQFREEGNEYDIRIMTDKKYRNNLHKIRAMTITTPDGDVPLRNFVKDTIAVGPVVIEHEDNLRIVSISGNIEGRDQGSIARDVQKILDETRVPVDFELELSGGFEEMQRSFNDLRFVILLALVLVYMIMVGQFESFKEPFIIMFTVPLALIGVLWMLFFTGTTINMQSLIGVLLLGGIVVNNAIVYIDYTNQLRRKQRIPLFEAVIEAGRVRLRPILMTAMTTSFGLIPMALGLGSGNELRAPMARAVIGGLLVSTFLTLVFIPTLYIVFEQRREKKSTAQK